MLKSENSKSDTTQKTACADCLCHFFNKEMTFSFLSERNCVYFTKKNTDTDMLIITKTDAIITILILNTRQR